MYIHKAWADKLISKRNVQSPELWSNFALVALTVVMGFVTVSSAQVVSNVYSFTGQNSSAFPSNVIPAQGRDGRLYGTTGGQGGTNYGTIFKLASTGQFRQLYTFDAITGSQPDAGVVLSSDGNLYGTAFSGGSSNDGVFFKITPGGTYTLLHEFAGSTDGAQPTAAPIQGLDGNLYGTTFGNATTGSTIYKYTRSTGTLSTLYQFDQAHGSSVIAPLIQATDGNLYGTASQGGANNCGTIFKVTTSGTLLWFYSFPCGQGGSQPVGPLIQATDGNFYGTTSLGGNSGVGTVFKLDQAGTVSILYNFQGFSGGATDGSTPFAGLAQATDGNLYGATNAGGTFNLGALFQITTNGAYKLLYNFTTSAGSGPTGSLVQHTNGLLYGTALQGGRFGFGTVYKLSMGLGPFVTLSRYQGKVGSTAQILGQGFTGTTAVTFNGVAAASFNVVSDTFLTAVVPSGATTGPVMVTTPAGTLTSNKNFVVPGTVANRSRTKATRPAQRL